MSQEILNDIAILCIEKDMILIYTQFLLILHLKVLVEISLYEYLVSIKYSSSVHIFG
jgi:hypothetical protein